MGHILFLSNISGKFNIMKNEMASLVKRGAIRRESRSLFIDSSTTWEGKWESLIRDTDLLVVRWMGTGLDTAFLRKLKDCTDAWGIPYFFDAGSQDSLYLAGLPEEVSSRIMKYFQYGGRKNYRNLLLYLDTCLTENPPDVEEPEPLCWCGIYYPNSHSPYLTLEDYKKNHIRPVRPTIGLLFYRDEWLWQDLAYQDALIHEIEKEGMNVIPVFSNGLPITEMGMPPLTEVFNRYFTDCGIPSVDVIINLMKFSLSTSGSLPVSFLKGKGVPILLGYSLMTEYRDWADSFEGMTPVDISISISLPEFDGDIHGVPVACKKILPNGEIRYTPIMESLVHMVHKAGKWARLRRKENSEKKIAIIFHNYPPKNSNIGNALGMDSIESVRILLKEMESRGYRVDFIPEDSEAFIKILTSHATNDKALLTEKQLAEAKKLPAETYRSYFDRMSEKTKDDLVKSWGNPPGTVMNYDGNLLVPGTMDGHVFITVQPPRGFGEDSDKVYHSPTASPTHHYIAFYQWLREEWKADAVVHVGTHGSLEWLPGKNAGLSASCYPDLALRDLPNVYPYNMTITGEGIQAKRRSSAVLISHLPAPQTQAGTYDELEELEKAMDEYIHFRRQGDTDLTHLEELILKKMKEANLEDEVVRDGEEPFPSYLSRLHNYISDLKNMSVHNGLHIMGRPPEGESLTEYIRILTQLPNGKIPSLNQGIANFYGITYGDLLKNSADIYEPLGITNTALVDRIIDNAREAIDVLRTSDFKDNSIPSVLALSWAKEGTEEAKKSLSSICSYICHTIAPHLAETSNEITHTLDALEGIYIEPSPSGAPSSGGADLLPTGRNFYGTDPRTLPTEAAWAIGKDLADQVIERFISEEGHYPENIGIVLWAGANMRSHGQCIAEVLYLLGIRPLWQSGSGRVRAIEPIPLSELKRPRIDVTSRISGLFRDAMPGAAEFLDKAVLMAASLEEGAEDNYVRKHVLEDSREMETKGMPKEEAWRQASYRIFGDPPGGYGAGIPNVLESKNWTTIDDLANVYIRWGGHAYGGKTRGAYVPELFRKRMGTLDVTIKNEDNHELNMFSSDDYNAYHGGMIAAVRSVRGKAPKSYCGDSTNRSHVVLHSLQEEAKRAFRSESINPKYIEGMMKHGYKGASDLSNMVSHSFQWDATSAVMEDWMYEKYAEKYALDEKVQKWMTRVNPWALQRLTETLLEASKRGLWHAKEETLSRLEELYLSIEGEIEEAGNDE